jgi:hypothetical protein
VQFPEKEYINGIFLAAHLTALVPSLVFLLCAVNTHAEPEHHNRDQEINRRLIYTAQMKVQ